MSAPIHAKNRFRNRLLRLTTVGTLFLLLSPVLSSSRAEMHLPPALTSDEAKIEFLRFVEESTVPGMWELGAEYDVDLFELLNKQNGLVTRLKQDPRFVRQAQLTPETMRIQIGSATEARPADKASSKAQLNPTAAENWKQRAIEYVLEHKFKSAREGHEYVGDKVSRLLERLSRRDPRAVMQGMIQCIPAVYQAQKTQMLQLSGSPAAQLEAIRAFSFPRDAEIAASFRADAFNLKPGELSRSGLLEIVSEGLQDEARLPQFMILDRALGALATAPATVDLKGTKLANALAAMDFGAFARFDDKQALGADGKRWFDGYSALEAKAMQAYLGRLSATVVKSSYQSGDLSGLQKQAAQTGVRKVEALSLLEVPPYVGIFRGFVGGDCSTQNSYPYVYSPMERTFFIFDANNQPRGYAMGTLVEVAGQRAFYLHDIVGAYLSERNVEDILHGMYAALPKLGATEMVLPTHQRIDANINYKQIQKVMQGYVKGSESVKIDYLDGPVRDSLASLAAARGEVIDSYDTTIANGTGHRFTPNRDELQQVAIETAPAPPPAIRANKISTEESLTLALILSRAYLSTISTATLEDMVANAIDGQNPEQEGRRETVQAVLNNSSLDSAAFEKLAEDLLNGKKRKLEDFYANLRAEFKESFGVTVDAKFEQRYAVLFAEGHLRAPDAFKTSNEKLKKMSVAYAVNLLKRWPNPKLAVSAVKSFPAEFSASDRFQNYLLSLLSGREADAKMLRDFLDAKVDFRALPANRDRLAVFLKRASGTHATALGERLAKEYRVLP